MRFFILIIFAYLVITFKNNLISSDIFSKYLGKKYSEKVILFHENSLNKLYQSFPNNNFQNKHGDSRNN